MTDKEISDLIVKVYNAIEESLKEHNVKIHVGKETGILQENRDDLVLYAKIKIK